jgi:DNA segregation ATPase FtsK/SpoIIIE-like protein
MLKKYIPTVDPDPFHEHALQYVRRDDDPSTAGLARELGINIGRAANLMRMLVEENIISEIGEDGRRRVIA